MPKPKYHIVVCTNARPPGHPKPSCGSAGAASLLMAFNIGLMQKGVTPGEVLVSGSSCLGPCEQGPTVVVYPDATWYSKVTEADVATILDEHIKGGKPVAKLNPDSVWKQLQKKLNERMIKKANLPHPPNPGAPRRALTQARPQPMEAPEAQPLGYVEDAFEVRTTLAAIFSIL